MACLAGSLGVRQGRNLAEIFSVGSIRQPQIILALGHGKMVLGGHENLLGLPVHLQLLHIAHVRHQRNEADAHEDENDRHDDQHFGQGKAFSIPTFSHNSTHLY